MDHSSPDIKTLNEFKALVIKRVFVHLTHSLEYPTTYLSAGIREGKIVIAPIPVGMLIDAIPKRIVADGIRFMVATTDAFAGAFVCEGWMVEGRKEDIDKIMETNKKQQIKDMPGNVRVLSIQFFAFGKRSTVTFKRTEHELEELFDQDWFDLDMDTAEREKIKKHVVFENFFNDL